MKVLHIGTKDTGGAAIAAIRLHRGLLASGVSSSFLFLKRHREVECSYDFKKMLSIRPSLLANIRRLIFRKDTVAYKQKQQLKRFPGTYEGFSFATSDYDITEHPAYQDADIVNLHWVPRFLDYPSFFRKNKKPLVWTLHDMNPFLGGFHYEGDLERNSEDLRKLSELVLKQKVEALKDAKIHIVAPSKWMLNASCRSQAFSSFPHSHIPYGLDLSVFKPLDKHFCREVFNLPQEKTILLFISERIDHQRKGFDLLQNALSGIDTSSITLCAVGDQTPVSDESIRSIAGIRDERLMSLLYNAADAFVLASREDNFPNVVLEATACGTPVIAFPIGGIPDIVQNEFNGVIAEGEEPTSTSLRQAILRFLNSSAPFDRTKIRNYTSERYALSDQASAYTALYQQILEK